MRVSPPTGVGWATRGRREVSSPAGVGGATRGRREVELASGLASADEKGSARPSAAERVALGEQSWKQNDEATSVLGAERRA